MEYQIKNIFTEKSCRPLIILLNNPNSHCMQETILKVRYFERGLSKSHKKVTFFLLLSPVSFNRQNYQKKEPGTSDQWLFRL